MRKWWPLLLLVLLAGCRGDTLMINSFETDADLDALTWRCPYWIERTTSFATHGGQGLAVEMPPGEYPTLELRDVPADWRGYRYFEVDLSLPELPGGELFIRIDDQGDSERFADRFTLTVPLTGKPQHVRVPLERIERGNGGRRLDLSAMDRILFYLKHSDRRVTCYLDGVRLSR
ncbi:MAG: hypothetical protein P9L99_18245 [Candidatus Lernaella stagnicola]|nr:hypothetical protein [Candidatus Lernaella stagnicola]